jgi:hypothetical protein
MDLAVRAVPGVQHGSQFSVCGPKFVTRHRNIASHPVQLVEVIPRARCHMVGQPVAQTFMLVSKSPLKFEAQSPILPELWFQRLLADVHRFLLSHPTQSGEIGRKRRWTALAWFAYFFIVESHTDGGVKHGSPGAPTTTEQEIKHGLASLVRLS